MRRQADGYLSDSESEAITRQLAEDASGAGMTHGLAAATGNDPELGGEKMKHQYEEDEAAERLCQCSSGGSYLGAPILVRSSPTHSVNTAMKPQHLHANLQAVDMGTGQPSPLQRTLEDIEWSYGRFSFYLVPTLQSQPQ
ncbi:UNVERIFIED_CONTAM: hypothetical protein K2H54_049483 [Gekko kuhli]